VTVYYVRSTDGNNADSGLTWALAKATIAGALAVAVAGDRIWVSQAHAESQASQINLPPTAGTLAAPLEIFCGNDAAEPPTALATTATVTTTGSNAITFFGAGAALYRGITFTSGAAITAGGPVAHLQFDTCTLTAATDFDISVKTGVFLNTTFTYGNGSNAFFLGGRVRMEGGAISGKSPLFPSGNYMMVARFIGVDLSAFAAGESLVHLNFTNTMSVITFEQCKLGASVALTTGASSATVVIALDNSDDGDTQYRMQRHRYEGDAYSETTIVRTGGASNGTTPLSHKLVSSAGLSFYRPFHGPEMVTWNNTPGIARTVTVEIIHDSVTALTDAEVWLEIEYLGTSGVPQALFARDRAADILATPVAQASSSVAWTTTGLTNPNKQKLEVTLTPQEIGIFRARVALAKPSYTIYVDPLMRR
jgi:hypothetical protein